jgi:nuclear pore complex protein Nup107
MQALRTSSGRDGLVREMDPDAISREEGRTLAADDAVSSQLAFAQMFC